MFDTTTIQDFLLLVLCVIVAAFIFKVAKKVLKVAAILVIAGLLMYSLAGCGTKPQRKTSPIPPTETQQLLMQLSTSSPEAQIELKTSDPTNTPTITISPQNEENMKAQPTSEVAENPRDKIKVKTTNIPLEDRFPSKTEKPEPTQAPTPEPSEKPLKDPVSEDPYNDIDEEEDLRDEDEIPDCEDIKPEYYGLVVTDTSNKDGCEFTNTDNTYAVTFTNTTEDLPLIVEFHVDVKDPYGEDIEAGAYTETVFPGESVLIILYEGEDEAGKVEVTVLQSVAE